MSLNKPKSGYYKVHFFVVQLISEMVVDSSFDVTFKSCRRQIVWHAVEVLLTRNTQMSEYETNCKQNNATTLAKSSLYVATQHTLIWISVRKQCGLWESKRNI